jgi:hypothetical protein
MLHSYFIWSFVGCGVMPDVANPNSLTRTYSLAIVIDAAISEIIQGLELSGGLPTIRSTLVDTQLTKDFSLARMPLILLDYIMVNPISAQRFGYYYTFTGRTQVRAGGVSA